MSTSVTRTGTPSRVGGSGRGLGIAATALAVVIAAGFVFAVNQGNEATTGVVDARINEPAFQAESDRLTGLAEYWIANDPVNYPSELKRLLAMIERANAESHPAFNIEKTRMELAGETGSVGSGVEQRLAHEFLEERRSSGPAQSNPLEGLAE